MAVLLLAALCALAPGVAGAASKGERAKGVGPYPFAGQARALSISLDGHDAVFGVAQSRATLAPHAAGAGAGHCRATNIGEIDEVGNLPCAGESTQTSSYPTQESEAEASCSNVLRKPLRNVISIRSACGASTSGMTDDLPFTENMANVPTLRAVLGFADVLPIDARATEPEVEQVSDYLTGLFASEIGVVTGKRLSNLEDAVGKLVTGYVKLARKLPRAGLISLRLGRSSSAITPEGDALNVVSTTSGARIGVLPLPTIRSDGMVVLGNPLRDGLLVIDVGGAAASAQVDRTSATSASSALAAPVTVRVRDLSKSRPDYVEVAVAEGESVTVLEGTPWESTITAGSAAAEKGVGSAAAGADPVHIALLTGMTGGGASLNLGAVHAVADLTAAPATAGPVRVPRTLLPATGGAKPFLVPGLLMAAAIAAVALGRARPQAIGSVDARGSFLTLMRLLGHGIGALRALPGSRSDLAGMSVEVRHRTYRTLAALLAVGGIGLFSYPLLTDLWATRIQESMTADFSRMTTSYVTRRIEVGEPLTRMEIPRLGVDILVVEGITEKALQAGAGHYPMMPLPGEPGNVAIAGHRTSFGSPFARIDELMPGDEIVLTTPIARHTYRVLARPSVAKPDDWSIITDYPQAGSYLTLTSCHPEGSDAYRIWVRAELATSSDSQEALG